MPRFAGGTLVAPADPAPASIRKPRFTGGTLVSQPRLTGKVTPMTNEERSRQNPSTNMIDQSGRQVFRDGVALNAVAPVYGLTRDIVGGAVDRVKNVMDWGIVGKNAVENALSPQPQLEDLITGQSPDRDLLRGVSRTPASGGTETFNNIYDFLGVARPERVVANTGAEQFARAAGEGAAMAALPEAALAAGSKLGMMAPAAVETLAPFIGRGESLGGMAGNAFMGAGAGVGAKVATDLAPDNLDPLAGLAGGLAGGGLATLAAEAPNAARLAARAAGDFVAPLTQGGREQMAGRALSEAATNPAALVDAIGNQVPLVPGSDPTTAQLAGDMGLLGLERGAAAKAPAEFNQRRADQNAARLNAMEGIQPIGTPEAVVTSVRSFLADIDRQTAQAVDTASQSARGTVDALGAGQSPDLAGNALRGNYEAARTRAKVQERALWSAVDPDGTLALPATNARSGAAQIARDMPTTAKPMDGEEAAIFAAAGKLGDMTRFSDLTALQSRIKTQMRAERIANGESDAYRRLTRLNGAVQSDLEGAIVRKVAQEQQAVAAGQMRVENTAEYRLAQERAAWYSAREARASGADGSTGTGAYAPAGPSSVSGPYGAEVQGIGRPGNAPGNPGLSPNAGGDGFQPVDPATLERLNAARAATRNRAETFDNPTLAPIRRREMASGPYQMPDSAVPARIFAPGAKSFDAVKAYRAAVGDDQALKVLEDYAIDRLRRAALREDGTFDPTKLTNWRRAHSDALRAFPALSEAIRDAGRASETLARMMVERKTRMDEAQLGAVGRLLGVQDPSDVVRVVGSIFSQQNAATQMFRLRAAIGSDEAGRSGLRRAVVEFMANRLIGNTEAATSGRTLINSDQFQTFVSTNKAALKAAGFGDDQLELMGRIAADLRQANRSISAARIPGGSNTAQDVIAARMFGQAGNMLKYAMAALAGSTAAGGLGAVAAVVINGMRDAGLRSIDDLVREALLDPALARMLLVNVPARSAIPLGRQIGNRLSKSLAIGAAMGDLERQQ